MLNLGLSAKSPRADVYNQRKNAQSDQAADNSDENANEQLRFAAPVTVTPWHEATMLLGQDNARRIYSLCSRSSVVRSAAPCL